MTKRRIEIGPFSPLGRTVDVAQALAHPSRLRLLALLRRASSASARRWRSSSRRPRRSRRTFRKLKRAGLVQERREGKLVFHRWSDDKVTRALLADVVARCAADPVVVEDRRIAARLRRVDVAVLCAASLDLAAVGIRVGKSKSTPALVPARA